MISAAFAARRRPWHYPIPHGTNVFRKPLLPDRKGFCARREFEMDERHADVPPSRRARQVEPPPAKMFSLASTDQRRLRSMPEIIPCEPCHPLRSRSNPSINAGTNTQIITCRAQFEKSVGRTHTWKLHVGDLHVDWLLHEWLQ